MSALFRAQSVGVNFEVVSKPRLLKRVFLKSDIMFKLTKNFEKVVKSSKKGPVKSSLNFVLSEMSSK